MKKQLIIMVFIAVTAAMIAPRSLHQVREMLVTALARTAAAMVVIAAALYKQPPSYDDPGYDPGVAQPYEPLQDAGLRAGVIRHAAYYPNTPMPNRLGCIQSCTQMWDDFGRPFQRCNWRCPRLAPELPRYYTPDYSRASPTYSASSTTPDMDVLIVMLAVIGVVAGVVASVRSRSRADLEEEMTETVNDAAAARAALERAARHADEMIARQEKAAFKRGRKG